MRPRVYLAGPDVFYPDFEEIFAARVAYCASVGLDGVVPFDNKLTGAEEIYNYNIGLIDSTAGIIANISPFRGPHCDVGTAFEIGYAAKRAIPIWGFSVSYLELADRIPGRSKHHRDDNGMAIENFGLDENLMIIEALSDGRVHRSFEGAANAAARMLLKQAV